MGSLVAIVAVVAFAAAAFAEAAGWFSPHHLTPQKMVDALAPPSGPALGHRRNHAKGVCFTGSFEANGAGSELSTAQVFTKGAYPVVGRFNLATANPAAVDGEARVRGLGVQITTPDRQQWRMAMITAPFFPVATPAAFYELLRASTNKDPDAIANFAGTHPEFATFGGWAKSAPWTESYAEDAYNSLNSFIFTDGSGGRRAARWSLIPTTAPVDVAPTDLAKRDPNFLEQDIAARVKSGPLRWTLAITLADPSDQTADPSKAWPDGRRKVEVGTLTVNAIIPEVDGPCREINFDPTVLPDGISTSDDPFPAARSAAYRVSFDRRTAEEKDYPHESTGSQP
jgi:catalase